MRTAARRHDSRRLPCLRQRRWQPLPATEAAGTTALPDCSHLRHLTAPARYPEAVDDNGLPLTQNAWIEAFQREVVLNSDLLNGRYVRAVALQQWHERGQQLDPDDAAALWLANRPPAGTEGFG